MDVDRLGGGVPKHEEVPSYDLGMSNRAMALRGAQDSCRMACADVAMHEVAYLCGSRRAEGWSAITHSSDSTVPGGAQRRWDGQRVFGGGG
jgi:hypothetical protein